jgi:predicted transport protein
VSDIKLFRVTEAQAQEMHGAALAVERRLQVLIENNLDVMLGVRFLASEHSTGPVHGGRIDTLGIDENGSPVILEYKRATNENVINQGLYYLDWLLDHRGDFTMLAAARLGPEVAEAIDWSTPRLVCIAGDFTRYDEHAVSQIGRNIELYRYRSYDDGFFLLELVNRPTGAYASLPGPRAPAPDAGAGSGTPTRTPRTVSDFLGIASEGLRERYEALDGFLTALGDDVSLKVNKNYFAYRRIKNFACVEVHTRTEQLVLFLKVDPDEVAIEEGFTRDVRNIGHFATGDLEVRLSTPEDLERAKPLVERSYHAS